MSLYSGFTTRQQETTYNCLIANTIKLLQSKLAVNLKNKSTTDPIFKAQLLNNFDRMTKLESQKYLQPKFSETIKPIIASMIKNKRNSKKTLKNTEFFEKISTAKLYTSSNSRSLTPTLPSTVKILSRSKSPLNTKNSEANFLYARLRKNN